MKKIETMLIGSFFSQWDLNIRFSFSTDVAVTPRSLDFDELKSIKINESMIIILSYAVALTAVYLFGIFFAQV